MKSSSWGSGTDGSVSDCSKSFLLLPLFILCISTSSLSFSSSGTTECVVRFDDGELGINVIIGTLFVPVKPVPP